MAGPLPASGQYVTKYRDEEILNTLHLVGKFDISDELNCGGCGYDTCRGFASAMLESRAEKKCAFRICVNLP
jgi:ArsR family metal-binding transcriptional regulator